MNFLEALKTGKDFRRKSWDNENWYLFADGDYIKGYGDSSHPSKDDPRLNYRLTAPSLLANDWEVKEKTTELTWDEIESALDKHLHYPHTALDCIKKELGFNNE